MRTWTVGAGSPGILMVGLPWHIAPTAPGNPAIVFELPAPAAIDRVAISVDDTADPAMRVDVDASTTSATDFHNAGTITFATGSTDGTLSGPIDARWLRFHFERKAGAAIAIDSLAATGTMGGSHLPLSGQWTLADDLGGGNDHFFANAAGVIAPDDHPVAFEREAKTFERDGTFDGGLCNVERPLWHGPIVDGVGVITGVGAVQVVAGGSLLIGAPDGGPFMARRVSHTFTCEVPSRGSGPEILYIERTPTSAKAANMPFPGRLVRTIFAPELSARVLAGAASAVLDQVCAADADLAPDQTRALLDYVAAGHVLTIRDADSCSTSSYHFVPYAFTTAASGANGAKSDRLDIADSSILGSSEHTDGAHYIDTRAYLANTQQQLGDSDVMKTTDPHWCGLMFTRNVHGVAGWVHAYARYGRGIILYNGFDVDDELTHIPQALAIQRLDTDLSPRSELPCSALVAGGLLVLSSTSRNVPFGTQRTLSVPFDVTRSVPEGTRRVAISVDGTNARGMSARLDRTDVMLGTMPQRTTLTVHVAANAPASTALFTVVARDENGETARAALTITVDEALARALEHGGRARIYGIHFDVASARIQPQSEATIREIAGVLRAHPTWRMRVEGYTDADGGVDYNKTLSVARARAVVGDLHVRYGIASPRLIAAGFGLGNPVASNATSAGKALNRRVELVRL